LHSRGRNSEAAQRFAERRRREDEAQRLRERVPALATLRLEVEERRGTAADPKYLRLIVVESAPALFELPCGDHACKDGGHDLTAAVLAYLASGSTRFEIEDACQGSIGTAYCGSVMRLIGTATYR
jgi:hypothetical protein